MDSTSRRKFLEAVAAGTATVIAATPFQAWARSGGDVAPASPEPSRIVCKVGDRTLTDALAVDVGSIRIPVIKDPATGALSYGKPIWGELTLTVGLTPGKQSDATFLGSWHKQAKKTRGEGDAPRRDISVILYARDKSTVLRTYHAKDCVPTRLDSGDQSTASEAKTLTCKVGHVEVELGAAPGSSG